MKPVARKPQKCMKCGAECPVVYDWLDHPELQSPPDFPFDSPWEFFTFDGVKFDNVTYGCPAHGEFFANGDVQKFLDPDIWVTGPHGERLFSV